MGMYEGRAALTKAMKKLSDAWLDTKLDWDDATTRRFEETFLQPLDKDFKTAAGAMDQMAVLLQSIRRDCA